MSFLSFIKLIAVRLACFSLFIVVIGILFAYYSHEQNNGKLLSGYALETKKQTNQTPSIIQILQNVSQIADQFPFNETNKNHLREKIISLMSKVDAGTLGIEFPATIPSSTPYKVLAGSVYKRSTKFEASIFAFPKTGNRLPLHDHPNMEGFIKALKGKLLITSFSLLDPEEEKKLKKEKPDGEHEILKPAKFEGTFLLDSSTNDVASLKALTGNIHSIESADGFGAFFDILIPGYQQDHGYVPCTYFELDNSNPTVGQIYWLRVIPAHLIPNLVSMGKLDISKIDN